MSGHRHPHHLLAAQRHLVVAAIALVTLAALLLGGRAGAQDTPQLRVVVSISPYADLVQRVAGERATVSTLLPPGASPHSFDPSPSQALSLARADLIVMNGGLDDWLVRLVAAAGPDASLLSVMSALRFEGIEELGDDAHSGPHAHGLVNPHVWLDPTLAIQAVYAIADSLTRLDPAGAATYSSNAARTKTELEGLDAELAQLLAPVSGAPFVPFHDAWVYFAARYGLHIVVTLEPFPGRQPSPRYIAEAVRQIQATGATAIFAERQLGARSAEVVAESAGVAVATLDPLGGAPGPVTYEELLLQNARIIVDTLSR